jgi:hypothetical protein
MQSSSQPNRVRKPPCSACTLNLISPSHSLYTGHPSTLNQCMHPVSSLSLLLSSSAQDWVHSYYNTPRPQHSTSATWIRCNTRECNHTNSAQKTSHQSECHHTNRDASTTILARHSLRPCPLPHLLCRHTGITNQCTTSCTAHTTGTDMNRQHQPPAANKHTTQQATLVSHTLSITHTSS